MDLKLSFGSIKCELALQDGIKYSRWSQALWIVFGSSRLGEGLQGD